MKAAVYLRVSSRDGRQDEANQEPDCLRLCEARGWEPVVFRERESGRKERPVWEEVKQAARVGQVRAVVVWSVSRVGRKAAQVRKDIAELAHYGAAVVSCMDKIVDIPSKESATTPLLMLMREQAIGWLGFQAEQEADDISKRTKAGHTRARAKGIHIGRKSKIPRSVVARALWIRASGVSWGQLPHQVAAEGLGRYSRGALERAVKRYTPSQTGPENGAPKPAPAAGFVPPGGGVSN